MNNSTYDKKPYATLALAEGELSRLAALARLQGLDVADPSHCSVLEIGCGTGGNSIALAERYPHSRFVAFDLSTRQIDEAIALTTRCGLQNISFVASSIDGFTCEPETFDYIICHGVFSWVAPEVQRQLFALCARALSPQGVTLITYNVNPGWRQRGALRDSMRSGAFARSRQGTPDEQVKAGMELLSLVTTVREKGDDFYGRYMREGLSRLQDAHASYVFHEYLEQYNEPVLFSDFMGLANEHRLQFLSEAKPSMMSSQYLGVEVAKYLESVGDDSIAREQCLDVLTNRMFRETILCRDSHPLRRDLKSSVFRTLVFETDYRVVPEATHADDDKIEFREIVSQRVVRAPRDEHAEILSMLGRYPFGRGEFALLVGQLDGKGSSLDERALLSVLVTLWRSGFVNLALPQEMPTAAKGRAQSSGIARSQAEGDGAVTSLLHRSHLLRGLERECVKLGDGALSFEDIAQRVAMGAGERESREALERVRELGFFYHTRSRRA